MKQTSATYQFELSEKELETLCTVLGVRIECDKGIHDSLKVKLEKEALPKKDVLESTKTLLKMKDDLRSLLDLYNGFGKPIAKFWSMSL